MSPGKWRRRAWSLTSWGRAVLDELDRNAEEAAAIHQTNIHAQQRLAEIDRQTSVLEAAARRNGFAAQLSKGFRPRTP